MQPLPVTLRKRRQVRLFPVTKNGQITADQLHLPPSARVLTGVAVFAQPRDVQDNSPLLPSPPVFLAGVATGVATAAAALTRGDLVLENGVLTARLTPSAGPGQYVFYACPVGLPTPVFTHQGLVGGFVPAGSLYADVVPGNGTPQRVACRLYQSVTPHLGAAIPLVVTHP